MIITRPLIALATCLIAVALPAGAPRAESQWPEQSSVEERPRDLPPWLLASRLGPPLEDRPRGYWDGLSDMGAVLLRDAPIMPIEPDPLTLRTSGEEDSPDLRVLLDEGERWHLMRFGAAAGRPQEAKVTAYGAVAYVPPSLGASRPAGPLGYGPAVAPGAAFGLDLDEQEEPVSLGLKSSLGDFEGGVEYRSVGKRLERLVSEPHLDTEGTEVWVAQRLGLLRLRLSQSDLSDNVDRHPALPRTNRVQTALSAQLTPPGWPILGLTYATGESERVWLTGEGHPRLTEYQNFDSLAGSAYYYGGSRWNVSASSTYVASRDAVRSDQEMTMLYHDLNLTLRPVDSVVVMPAVGSGIDRYESSRTRSRMGWASLYLSYGPLGSWWNLWTLAAYSSTQSSDHTVDGRNLSWSGGLSCGLGRLLGGNATLSFQAGYDRYVDSVYPESSARGVVGLVLLKVTSF
ncbi:MAG: hypothetical protein ACREKQ_09170 [Candidatus Rokuibacteriota bacterium]